MDLGIFARTFGPTRDLEDLALTISTYRALRAVQFNFSCVGLPTLAEQLDPKLCSRVSSAMRKRGLRIAAVSGTFNMVRPVPVETGRGEVRAGNLDQPVPLFGPGRSPSCRAAGERLLERLDQLASACRWLDTRIITLCPGTCDPVEMWRWHPDNVKWQVWQELVGMMRKVAEIADRHEVIMAFEPELGTVVNSAARARLLLDTVGSPWLKVVIDPANLVRAAEPDRMNEVVDEAFEWLGRDIVLAHAKELGADGRMGSVPPGKGILNWDHYLLWLERIGYAGPLILHGLEARDVPDALTFLSHRLEAVGSAMTRRLPPTIF
jgi:sugar phosphate isomerase/epimerase